MEHEIEIMTISKSAYDEIKQKIVDAGPQYASMVLRDGTLVLPQVGLRCQEETKNKKETP